MKKNDLSSQLAKELLQNKLEDAEYFIQAEINHLSRYKTDCKEIVNKLEEALQLIQTKMDEYYKE